MGGVARAIGIQMEMLDLFDGYVYVSSLVVVLLIALRWLWLSGR
jgi:hypothetical protein